MLGELLLRWSGLEGASMTNLNCYCFFCAPRLSGLAIYTKKSFGIERFFFQKNISVKYCQIHQPMTLHENY